MRQIILISAVVLGTAGRAVADPIGLYAGISVEELFDSNVENNRGPDAVTRIAPRIGLALERPTWQLDADYMVAFHEYALGTADGSVNQRAALALHDAFGERTTLDVRSVFLDASDPILIERAGVAIPFGPFIDWTSQATLAIQATRRTTVSLAYMYRMSRFESATESDGDEHRADANLVWRWTRRLDLITSARAQKFVSYGGPDPGGAVGGAIGLGYRLTPAWRVQAEGGPLVFLPNASPTWIGDARITRTGPRTRVSLVGVRDLYGGTGNQSAIWDDSLYLQLVWQATRHLWVHARAGAYASGNAPNGARQVTGLDAAGDVGWMLFHGAAHIDLFAEHRMQDVTGGVAFADVTRTIAGIRLVAYAGGTHGDDLP